jgi:cytoskeleton protein RodZ
MSALGDTFRAARESKSLTLSDVAEYTHIRSVYLEAIEAEDWDTIGPPVYVRGFIRTYARFLGLDPEAACSTYAPATPLASPAHGARRGEPLSGERGKGAKRGLSIGAVAAVLVAFALVLFVGFQYVDYHRGQAAPAAAVTAAPSRPPARPERSVREGLVPVGKTAGSAQAGKAEPRARGFAVRLRDNSWLRMVVDGKVEMEGLFQKGTKRTFAGRSATIRVGNAGGVEISVDGKDLGPMGGLGDVAERSYQR